MSVAEETIPKVNISARLSLESFRILEQAAQKTGRTKSELVDECVREHLAKTSKGKAAK
jgi:predicted DNA-binding protein